MFWLLIIVIVLYGAYMMFAHAYIMVSYFLSWCSHKFLQKNKRRHKRLRDVSIFCDFLDEKDDLYIRFFGQIESVSIRKRLVDSESIYDHTEYAYAVFKAAYRKKWELAPGDLIYYEHKGKKFYVAFKPYSKNEALRHVPSTKLSDFGSYCLTLFWTCVAITVILSIIAIVNLS